MSRRQAAIVTLESNSSGAARGVAIRQPRGFGFGAPFTNKMENAAKQMLLGHLEWETNPSELRFFVGELRWGSTQKRAYAQGFLLML